MSKITSGMGNCYQIIVKKSCFVWENTAWFELRIRDGDQNEWLQQMLCSIISIVSIETSASTYWWNISSKLNHWDQSLVWLFEQIEEKTCTSIVNGKSHNSWLFISKMLSNYWSNRGKNIHDWILVANDAANESLESESESIILISSNIYFTMESR